MHFSWSKTNFHQIFRCLVRIFCPEVITVWSNLILMVYNVYNRWIFCDQPFFLFLLNCFFFFENLKFRHSAYTLKKPNSETPDFFKKQFAINRNGALLRLNNDCRGKKRERTEELKDALLVITSLIRPKLWTIVWDEGRSGLIFVVIGVTPPPPPAGTPVSALPEKQENAQWARRPARLVCAHMQCRHHWIQDIARFLVTYSPFTERMQ